KEICAAYDDLDAVRQFAEGVDVVTYEFENVPSATAAICAEVSTLWPDANALHVAQNRLREKAFFTEAGLRVVPHFPVRRLEDVYHGLVQLGDGCVLKSAELGYDGKGQVNLQSSSDAATAWEAIGQVPAVLEKFIDLDYEISVVAARGQDGSFVHYGAIRNAHQNHILHTSVAPADVPPAVADAAVVMTHTVADKLNYVGTLCVEFFVTKTGTLFANEMAPRPHNSGHLTVDACQASQFEQQLRAVCGLALGSADYLRPATMINLLGDLWQNGTPDWATLCQTPHLSLHLYGKQAARVGRKMGHFTVLADTSAEAAQAAQAAFETFRRKQVASG
ncbi:MAG: 5-(carboxyamino)imidazole ribonucleotide synthase, partial [Candidatus Promineifilaceae bacterium]